MRKDRRPTGRRNCQHLRHHPSLGGFRRDLGALPAHRRHAGNGGRLRPEGQAAAGAWRPGGGDRFRSLCAPDMDKLIDAWLPMEFATNSLNRSMGQTDLYPVRALTAGDRQAGFVHVLSWLREAARAKRRKPFKPARPACGNSRAIGRAPLEAARSRGCPYRLRFPGCTVPPWASTSPLTMARPRPVPLSAMATSCLPWPKLSNTRGLVFGAQCQRRYR